MRVAVIIPTLNRATFVIRQLRYYAALGVEISVYVGDASSGAEAERLAQGIARLSDLRCVYVPSEGLNERRTIVRLLRMVTEPYCAFCGDDDYLVPQSLEMCGRFLAENPEYRTAQGRGIVFALGEPGDRGVACHVGDYWGRPSNDCPSAKLRTAQLGMAYWVSLFSVHRTAEFLADWAPFEFIADSQLGELGPCFLTLARGKSKFLDCLYLARQVHSDRRPQPRGLQWIAKPEWSDGYQMMRSAISTALSELDHVPIEDARRAFEQAFEAYVSGHFARTEVKSKPDFLRSLRHAAGSVSPGLAAAARIVRDSLGPRDALTFLALRRASSPYHAAFASLYASMSLVEREHGA